MQLQLHEVRKVWSVYAFDVGPVPEGKSWVNTRIAGRLPNNSSVDVSVALQTTQILAHELVIDASYNPFFSLFGDLRRRQPESTKLVIHTRRPKRVCRITNLGNRPLADVGGFASPRAGTFEHAFRLGYTPYALTCTVSAGRSR